MKQLTIVISRRENVNEMLSLGTFDAVVSIGPVLEFSYRPQHVLHLAFSERQPWERVSLNTLPHVRHVIELVDFAQRLPPNARVLIHCGSGHCRSPAAAMIILASVGWSSVKAVEEVHRIKEGKGNPMGWLLKLADAILDTTLFNTAARKYRVRWVDRGDDEDMSRENK
jgi:predicted protein tyrosine phosphatase